MFVTLGAGDNNNTLSYGRAIPLQRQPGNLKRTVKMLLRQSEPFGIVSHARGRHEAGGEVVVRLNILDYNFLLIKN